MSEDIKLEVSHDKHPKAPRKIKPADERLTDKPQQGAPSVPTLPPANKQQPNKQLQEGKPPPAKPNEPKRLQQSNSMPDNPVKQKNQSNTKDKNPVQPLNAPKFVPVAPPEPHKPTKQQLALNRIEYSKNSIAENLKLLLSHYKEIGEKEIKLHGHNPEKEAEIKQFLDGLHLERRNRKARLRKLEKSNNKRDRQEKERSFELEEKVKQRRLQVVKYLEESKLTRQANEQERAKQKERWEKFYKEFKKIKPLYVVKEQQQRKALEEERKELEDKISVLKMRNKPIDAQELEAHMERHRRIIEELARQKAQEKEQWRKRIEEQNSKIQEMWKGQCHRTILEEERERQAHSKQPFEKLKRVREYKQVVRQYYMPELPRRKSQGSLQGSEELVSDRPKGKKRYRYMNGVSYGEVYEPEHPQLSEAEQRRLGNAYLQILRRLPKRKQEVSNLFNDTAKERLKLVEDHAQRYKLGNSYLHSAPLHRKNHSVDLPSNASRGQVSSIIEKLRHDNVFFEQKEKLLKFEKMPVISPHRQDRQREIDEKVIESIEKKMSLLQKLHSDRPQPPMHSPKTRRITLITNEQESEHSSEPE